MVLRDENLGITQIDNQIAEIIIQIQMKCPNSFIMLDGKEEMEYDHWAKIYCPVDDEFWNTL